MNRLFQALWFSWFIFLLVVEAAAMVYPGPMDTLSEWTRLKTTALPMKMALGGVLVWLCYHWLFARNGQHIGYVDVSITAIGMLLGFVAYLEQHGGSI
jgi:hypothetical protein